MICIRCNNEYKVSPLYEYKKCNLICKNCYNIENKEKKDAWEKVQFDRKHGKPMKKYVNDFKPEWK